MPCAVPRYGAHARDAGARTTAAHLARVPITRAIPLPHPPHRRHHSHHRHRHTPRAGFTLVELLVAALLLSVGLIALAASAGHYTCSVARANALAHAARRARAALEAERAHPCAAATPAAQPVAATVALPAGVTHAGSSSLTLRSAFPCPR